MSKPPEQGIALIRKHLGMQADYDKWPSCYQALATEIERLQAELSSNLCSAHQTPDPLNCDTCNKVKWLENANTERMAIIDRLQAELREAREAQ